MRLVAECADRPLLSLVLVATDTFARWLARPALVPLAGRLPVRLRLAPLSLEQAAAFVDHTFITVGMPNLLAPSALPAFYTASSGSPRRLGRLVAAALEHALDKRAKLLTDEIIQEVQSGDGAAGDGVDHELVFNSRPEAYSREQWVTGVGGTIPPARTPSVHGSESNCHNRN